MKKNLILAGVVLLMAFAGGGYWFVKTRPLPPPQITSLSGRPAPDFTLKDQDGRDFHLAARRGHPVLLYFYRGYW